MVIKCGIPEAYKGVIVEETTNAKNIGEYIENVSSGIETEGISFINDHQIKVVSFVENLDLQRRNSYSTKLGVKRKVHLLFWSMM